MLSSVDLPEPLGPITDNPEFRRTLLDVRHSYEQAIDETSKDEVTFAGASKGRAESRERPLLVNP